MASIPLPALAVQPPQQPDILGQFGKVMALKSLMGGQRLQQEQLQAAQQENQQRGLQLQDQQKMRAMAANFLQKDDAGKITGYDTEGYFNALLSSGVNPATVAAQRNQYSEAQLKTAAAGTAKLELQNKTNDQAYQVLEGMRSFAQRPGADPQAVQQTYMQSVAQLKNLKIDTSQFPAQFPGDAGLTQFEVGLGVHKQMLTDAKTGAETAKDRADAAKANMEAGPLNVDQVNSIHQKRWQVLHPGEALPQEYQLQYGANRMDYDRVDKSLGATEQAEGTKAQRDATQAFRQQSLQLAQGTRRDARSDRSYQYASSQLDKTGQPISDALGRLGRLQTTINQSTPQADALVAPELLTVMAGGQGSGLRMNEAEIARIVGGRSNFEGLKAALNKWQVDPSKALSITPAQRQQIRSLVDEVQNKLLTKQQIIEDSRQTLIGSDDPEQHRQIVAGAKSNLAGVDSGTYNPPAGGGGINHPNNSFGDYMRLRKTQQGGSHPFFSQFGGAAIQ